MRFVAKTTKNKDPLVVYWSVAAPSHNVSRINLMWQPPVPVIATLSKNTDPKKNHYMGCFGMKQVFKNAFALIHPADSEAALLKTENGRTPAHISGLNAWKERDEQILDNKFRVLYDFSWSFFSEESVVITMTPPYLHNTAERPSGVLTAGAFDISKWFRPLFLDYILWGDSTNIKVKKNDPACYIFFNTDRRVILKQFDMTDELWTIGSQVTMHKDNFPNEALNVLYNRFTRSNRHKKVIKLIKENLLD